MKISCTGLSKKLVMLIGLGLFVFPSAVIADANSWQNVGSNMYSTVSGNVGIGINTPATKLHLGGGFPTLRIGNGSVIDGGQIEWRTTAPQHWNIDQLGDTLRFFTENSSNDSSGSVKLAFKASGNVGIGTMSPGAKLDIAGAYDATGLTNTGLLELGDTLRLDGDEVLTNTNTPLYLQRDNNGDLLVDGSTLAVDASANRVGIGSVSPLFTLDVNGEIRSESVSLSRTDADGAVFFNAYYNAGTKYINADSAFQIVHESATDDLVIKRATVGSANGAATFIDALKINSNGQICIGNCN